MTKFLLLVVLHLILYFDIKKYFCCTVCRSALYFSVCLFPFLSITFTPLLCLIKWSTSELGKAFDLPKCMASQGSLKQSSFFKWSHHLFLFVPFDNRTFFCYFTIPLNFVVGWQRRSFFYQVCCNIWQTFWEEFFFCQKASVVGPLEKRTF